MAKKKAGKSRRGFAAMDPELQRKIASKGGKTAQAFGNAHNFTVDEATAAGKKGGRSLVDKLGYEYMAEIGARGGRSAQRKRRRKA